jgi:hypothetical protein
MNYDICKENNSIPDDEQYFCFSFYSSQIVSSVLYIILMFSLLFC